MMESWRKFFKSSGIDICTLIENAIIVASSDYPQELEVRRDRIAQRLFTSTLVRCGECNALNSTNLDSSGEDDIAGAVVARCEDGQNDTKGSRDESPDSKVTSSSNEGNKNMTRNYSYYQAEALTEEIEEESQIIREVDRIKDTLSNPDESENQLYESLRILELRQLSVDILRATAIGKTVNRLKKHSSMRIQSIAKQLISGWKDLMDVWLKTADDVAAAAIGTSPDSVSPEAFKDDDGLPSPPLDEGAFLTAQTTSIEMSQFFDGMDEDGNIRNTNGHDKDGDAGYFEKQCTVAPSSNGKQSIQRSNSVREGAISGKQGTPGDKKATGDTKSHIQKQKNTDHRHSISILNDRAATSMRVKNTSGMPQRNELRDNVRRCSDPMKNQIKDASLPPRNKPTSSVDISVRVEASKRKLQERYQQAETAKRQRTVQVMDLQDLPKNGRNLVKPSQAKLGSQNRQRFINRI